MTKKKKPGEHQLMFICGFYLVFFFQPLSASKKIIDGNNFFCQGQASQVKSLLFPLQNVCNNSVYRLMIHGAFPVFICTLFPSTSLSYYPHHDFQPCPSAWETQGIAVSLLECSLLPLPLQNRKIKNFPWIWHQELQIPTLSGSSWAAVCDPDLSWEHLQVMAHPSWDEPLQGRTEGHM